MPCSYDLFFPLFSKVFEADGKSVLFKKPAWSGTVERLWSWLRVRLSRAAATSVMHSVASANRLRFVLPDFRECPRFAARVCEKFLSLMSRIELAPRVSRQGSLGIVGRMLVPAYDLFFPVFANARVSRQGSVKNSVARIAHRICAPRFATRFFGKRRSNAGSRLRFVLPVFGTCRRFAAKFFGKALACAFRKPSSSRAFRS